MPARIPAYGWWIMLAAVIATGVLANWIFATGLLIVLLVQVDRPFDFIVAFVLVTAGASFVYYEGGHLTLQLGLLTAGILLMLLCYAITNRDRILSVSSTSLTRPLLLYAALSFANFLRGLVAGYPPKHVAIEFIPVLALGSSLLVANTFTSRRDLRLAVVGMLGMGLGHMILGLYVLSIVQVRTNYFTPVPGLVAMLLINVALRLKSPVAGFGWAILSLPLFLHQFASYTRGYWLGCAGGLLLSAVIFCGFGRGSRARWLRTGQMVAALGGLGVVGALSMAVLVGRSDFIELASSRLASMTGTGYSTETASNLTRLVEYFTLVRHIAASPWVGHGLGYNFLLQDPFGYKVTAHWWVHQNFLLVWLKQGMLGLVLFVWMIWSAIVLGVREARRREDPWESAWFASVAAGTVYMVMDSMVHFPFDEVNAVFTLSLLWGGGMAMARKDLILFRWAAPAPATHGFLRPRGDGAR